MRKLFFILLLPFSFSLASFGQGTVLVPGDIMVLQIDEAEVTGIDSFIFVTFVDLDPMTTIYFTDCGVFPVTRKFTDPTATTNTTSGINEYPSCPEGAVKFVVPTGITIAAGTIVQYFDGTPDTRFSAHNDALITGTLDFYTKGDQVVVFQQKTGTSYPSEDPDFIFILNADAGFFSLDPTSHFNHSPYYITPTPSSPQENELSGTSIPLGLQAPNSPEDGTATALAVGEGTAELDNVIFNGTGDLLWLSGTPPPPGPPIVPFTNIVDAKKAILRLRTGGIVSEESIGYNWLGESNTGGGDPEDLKYIECIALLLSVGNFLPVELTSFIGRPKVKTIDLQWVTASETNNDYFEVEKSINGVDFKALTEIDGMGTTTLQSKYNWSDQSPNDGLNYYRLLQVDFNGDKSYSDIIVIEFEADRSEIQVYPNPTIRELNINLPESWDDETSIVIYDFYGKLINSFTISTGSLTFPVDNIPAGFYRLSAINKSKILNTSFVKN